MSYFSTSWTLEITPVEEVPGKTYGPDSDQADYIVNKLEAFKYELENGPEGKSFNFTINYN